MIEVERDVLAAVHEAEAEAQRAIEETRAELASRASERDEALEASVRDLQARLDRERSAALAEIERSSDAAAELYRCVDEQRVRALGAYVAKRVSQSDLEPDEAARPDRLTITAEGSGS